MDIVNIVDVVDIVDSVDKKNHLNSGETFLATTTVQGLIPNRSVWNNALIIMYIKT